MGGIKNIENYIIKKTGTLILGVIVFAYLQSEYEKNTIKIRRYTIKTKKPVKSKKIAFLSDLHDKEFGLNNEKLLELLKTENPDIVCIGGDMPVVQAYTEPKKDVLDITLKLMSSISKKYRVVYANGNHELKLRDRYTDYYNRLSKELKNMDIEHLHNSSIIIDGIRISGLDIDQSYYRKLSKIRLDKSYIKDKLGSSNNEYFELLLAHSPLYMDAYETWGADLTLSGHFHGGTIRIGKDIGLMTPQLGFFSDRVVGLKKKNNSNLIISAGLGTHSVNIRLNNLPELVMIDIVGNA